MSWIFFAALPIFSTLLGGYVVYRWKKDLHPWLSFSGGVLLGVAFLDLFPEALEQAVEYHLSLRWIAGAMLIAILLFHILDKLFSFHAHHEHGNGMPHEPCENERHKKTHTWIRASSLILHSFFDGIAIGGGFMIDARLGLVVVLAVIMHDFSDGMSTVTIMRNGFGDKRRWIRWMLLLDALAPFLGALLGSQLVLGGAMIALILAFFSGFFVFLALSELLPQAHGGTLSHRSAIFLTFLGIFIVFLIQQIAPV